MGKPFVGPAGRILDRALDDAGIARGRVFVTNAVKHFKYEQRGKRRPHKRPNADEIESYRWWLDLERALVKPTVILALGATAARSLLGRLVTLAKARGRPIEVLDGATILVTIHPSFLLRLREAAATEREYRTFVADLRAAAALSGLAASSGGPPLGKAEGRSHLPPGRAPGVRPIGVFGMSARFRTARIFSGGWIVPRRRAAADYASERGGGADEKSIVPSQSI
jgi:uracil-DNA glycosylase family 4